MAGSTEGYEIDHDLRSRSQSPLFWGVKLLNAVLMAQKKKKRHVFSFLKFLQQAHTDFINTCSDNGIS